MGILWAALSALAWTLLDAQRKALSERVAARLLVVVLSLGVVPGFVAWAAWDARLSIPNAGYVRFGVPIIGLQIAANLAFLHAVRISRLSLTIPLLTLTPVLSAIAAGLILGEWPARTQIVGIGFVLIGAALLFSSTRAKQEGEEPAVRRRRVVGASAGATDRGPLWMLGVAVLWAVATALDKAALAHAEVPVHGAISGAGVGIVTWVVFVLQGGRRSREQVRALSKHAPLVALAVVTATLALGLQLLALEDALVAQVETIKRAIGVVGSVVLGAVLFRETISRRRWAGALSMVLGAVAMGLDDLRLSG